MTEYIFFTDEQKQTANSVDLEDFLNRQSEQLIRSGRDKRLKSDHSITIRGNCWFDHSMKVLEFLQGLDQLVIKLYSPLEGEIRLTQSRGNVSSKHYTGKSKGIGMANLDAFVFIYRSKMKCLSGTE